MRVTKIIFIAAGLLTGLCTRAQNAPGPIIDAHCHFKTCEGEPFKTKAEYFEANKGLDVRHVFALTMAQKGEPEKTAARNDSLLWMAREDPRVIPVCSVHPYDEGAALAELDRVAALGVRIIKLHPISQNFEILDPRVVSLVRAAGEKKLTILTDGYGFLRPTYVDEILKLALMCSKTRIIIAHMGGSDFYKLGTLPVVMRQNPGMFDNLWYDISATVCIYADSPYADQLLWTIRQLGTGRILFGCDDPAFSLPQALEALGKLDLTPRERENIRYENARRLLGLAD